MFPRWYTRGMEEMVFDATDKKYSNNRYLTGTPGNVAQRARVGATPGDDGGKSIGPFRLDQKSSTRERIFGDAQLRARAAADASRSPAHKVRMRRVQADATSAQMMHVEMSAERRFEDQRRNITPNKSLPYKPATAKSGRVPTPPRPSSGVSPRIAGMGAAAILKGTGALSALPAIVHLARGKSLGSMAGPIPSHILPKKVQRSIRRAESVRGVW